MIKGFLIKSINYVFPTLTLFNFDKVDDHWFEFRNNLSVCWDKYVYISGSHMMRASCTEPHWASLLRVYFFYYWHVLQGMLNDKITNS